MELPAPDWHQMSEHWRVMVFTLRAVRQKIMVRYQPNQEGKHTEFGGDGMQILAETQELLDMAAAQEGPKLHEMDPVAAREVMAPMVQQLDLPPIDIALVKELEIPGPGGTISARLYTPAAAAGDGAVLLYFHGGGWVLGSVEQSDSFCRHMAETLGLRVVSVEYRMAPEHVFPAAYDDCLATTNWVTQSPAELGTKVTHVLVSGDSAGGNLAAAVSGSGEAKPAAQLLFYPVTDISSQTASYADFAEGYFLEKVGMEWFRDHYLTDPEMARDIRVSPLLAEDLSMVPPTTIVTCGLDVLRDEGRAYAAKLAQQGVRVSYSEAPGLIHGIVNFRKVLPTGANEVDRVLQDFACLLKELAVTT
ncbi:alpha/beta hydrolase [Martelella sp. AMO21009]